MAGEMNMAPSARLAQSFSLGMGTGTGAAVTLQGTAQIPTLLQDLQIMSQLAAGGQSHGLVTAIRLAGQRLDVSDQGSDLQAWRPDSQSEMQRSVGIPIDSQQVFAIDITPLNPTDLLGAAVGSDPISPQQFVPTTELGEGLNYVCGLGLLNLGAGATGALTATIRRPCKLGRMGISLQGAGVDMASIQVRSITINNLEFLCGSSGPGTPVDSVPALLYSWLNTDRDGNTLAVPVGVNDQISITFTHTNGAGAAVNIYGAIFCMPDV